MYSIELTKKAILFLKKLPKKDTEIILKKIYSLRVNPFPFIKRLQGHKLWRLRVLKYRIILDIVISGQKIIVLRVGYRKNVYNK